MMGDRENVYNESNQYEDYYARLAEFFSRVYENPEARRFLNQLQNMVGVKIVEMPVEDVVDERVEMLTKELERVKKKLAEKEQAEARQKILEVLNGYGLDESHLPKIQNFMMANGILNFELATRLYTQSLVNSMPNTPSRSVPIDTSTIEKYQKGGKQALYESIYKHLNDLFR